LELTVPATATGGLTRRRRDKAGDRIYRYLLITLGAAVLLALILVVCESWALARPALSRFGLSFLGSSEWDPTRDAFGALPFLCGTLLTSAEALLLALPVGFGAAIFLSEMAPARIAALVRFPIEMLAAIPSVVIGLWGLFVIAPILRLHVEPALSHTGLAVFSGAPLGVGLLAAGVVLAVMVLPTVTSLSLEVLRGVPHSQREGFYSLGATRWEMIQKGVLPTAKSGLWGATVLALGRALGETMAVAMVIGNSPDMPHSLLGTGATLASVIANEFTEAVSDMHQGALAELGLVLLGVTLLLSIGGRLLLRRTLK
jgi:phosphate transport system permease protein